MSKLKLLQVTHDLNIGGLQKLVVDIATNIDRSIFDVAVCCLRETGPFAKQLLDNDIPIYEINQIVDGKTNYLSFYDVYKILRKEKIDIIHTHNTNPFIDGGLAAILARTPVRIHTDHAREYPDKKRYMLAERILSVFYDQIVAVSEQTRDNLIEYEKIAPSRIVTIQNGVSYDKSVIHKRSNKKLADKFIIGSIGRLCKAKGYEYLIEAMSLLKQHAEDFELQIVGDGELMESLNTQIKSLQLEGIVKLVGEQSDVTRYYEAFDIFTISSISEGLPLVLLEAMAYGVPIIATDVGGIAGVVRDGYSAAIIQPHSAEALAERIYSLMNDKSERDRFMNNAMAVFNENYEIDRMVDKYVELFTKNLPSGRIKNTSVNAK